MVSLTKGISLFFNKIIEPTLGF